MTFSIPSVAPRYPFFCQLDIIVARCSVDIHHTLESQSKSSFQATFQVREGTKWVGVKRRTGYFKRSSNDQASVLMSMSSIASSSASTSFPLTWMTSTSFSFPFSLAFAAFFFSSSCSLFFWSLCFLFSRLTIKAARLNKSRCPPISSGYSRPRDWKESMRREKGRMLHPGMWRVVPFALTWPNNTMSMLGKNKRNERNERAKRTSPNLQVIARCFKGCFNSVLSILACFEASTRAADAVVSAPFARAGTAGWGGAGFFARSLVIEANRA